MANMYTEIKDFVVRKMRNNRKEVALALSSGGARGLAHIGAIEELVARGYHIHAIAGTSMGALVGAMYASGHLEDYREWMKTIDKKRMRELTDFSLGLDHFVKGKRIIEAMREVVPDMNIEDMAIPFVAIATDWESGHEVVFKRGSMYEAIRASISLPGYFEPVRRGGKLLIDGGTTNPLPLNRVRRKPGDLLVGVDVCGHDYKGELIYKNMVERRKENSSAVQKALNKILPEALLSDINYYTLLNRTASIMIHQNAQLQIRLTQPDILLSIQMKRYGGGDYDKSERLVAIGREKMRRTLDDYEGNN